MAVEVHKASDGEVDRIIAKKRASAPRLAQELKAGRSVARWCWVATPARVTLNKNSREFRKLAAAGIQFVGHRLTL